jgi:hypothetical protein
MLGRTLIVALLVHTSNISERDLGVS